MENKNLWHNFLTSNSPTARVLRTIVQGVLAVFLQNLADYLNLLHMTPQNVVLITPIIMAILSPIMAMLGDSATKKASDNMNSESDQKEV